MERAPSLSCGTHRPSRKRGLLVAHTCKPIDLFLCPVARKYATLQCSTTLRNAARFGWRALHCWPCMSYAARYVCVSRHPTHVSVTLRFRFLTGQSSPNQVPAQMWPYMDACMREEPLADERGTCRRPRVRTCLPPHATSQAREPKAAKAKHPSQASLYGACRR